jgi:hypothetical protein
MVLENVAGQRATRFKLCCVPQIAVVICADTDACDLPGLIDANKLTFLLCVMVGHDVTLKFCPLTTWAIFPAPLRVRCALHGTNGAHSLMITIDINRSSVFVLCAVQKGTVLVTKMSIQI